MNTKQRKAKAYAKKECPYEGKMRMQMENDFKAGWDACLKHLGEIPWDKAMNEICNHITNNSSNKEISK